MQNLSFCVRKHIHVQWYYKIKPQNGKCCQSLQTGVINLLRYISWKLWLSKPIVTDTIKMQNRNDAYQTTDTGRLIWVHTLWRKQVAQNDKTEK